MLTSPQQTTFKVRWQAVVHEHGGQFLLARGTDETSLVVVARLEADDGRFEFVDRVGLGESRLYQLRYRDRQGREFVLAQREIGVQQLSTPPLLSVSGPPAPMLVPRSPSRLPAPGGAADLHHTASPLASQFHIEPPTPPPRRGLATAQVA